MKASHVNVTNATIDFVLQATSDDKVHWALAENTTLTMGKIDIDMHSKVLNELVKLSSGIINKIIKDQLPKVSAVVDTEIEAINKMIANEGPYTFDVSLPGLGASFPMNLTMTSAPNVTDNIIKVNFDGLFDAPENTTSPADFPILVNAEWPQRFEHSLSEQLFIHESVLNSLFRVANDGFFPYAVRNANISDALLAAFPVINETYGAAANVSMHITFMPNATEAPINFNATRGIVLGDLDDVKSVFSLKVSNASVTDKEIAIIQTNFEMAGNMTMKDLVFYPEVQDVTIVNSYVKKDHLGLEGDFDEIF